MKRRADAAYVAAKAHCDAISREGDEFARTEGGGIAISQEIMDRFSIAADRRQKKNRQAWRAWRRCKRQAIEGAAWI